MGRVVAGSENLSRLKRTVAVAEENGHLAGVSHVGIAESNDGEVIFGICIEVAAHDCGWIFAGRKVHGSLKSAVTLAQQDANPPVVGHSRVSVVQDSHVQFSVTVEISNGNRNRLCSHGISLGWCKS